MPRSNAQENQRVCRFYMSGNCRFGTECRFRHAAHGGRQNDQNRQTQNNSASNATSNAVSIATSNATNCPQQRQQQSSSSSGQERRSQIPQAVRQTASAPLEIPEDSLNVRVIAPDEMDEDGDFESSDYEDQNSDYDFDDMMHEDEAGIHFDLQQGIFHDHFPGFGFDSSGDDDDDYEDGFGLNWQPSWITNGSTEATGQPWTGAPRTQQPDNSPAAANGGLSVDEINNFTTRVTQSIESKDAEIKDLKVENERLKEIVEGKDSDDSKLCTLKCGVCLDIKKATDFSVNSPCGHCFCKGCNDRLRTRYQRDCPKCRTKIQKQTTIFV